MVEYIDNTVIAQLALPDMRNCIRYAVSYPTRADVEEPGLDFTSMPPLTFERPDTETFPLLGCIGGVLRRGGVVPTALIAADEEAVDAFLDGRISFYRISEVVIGTLDETPDVMPRDPDDLYAAETDARAAARRLIAQTGV